MKRRSTIADVARAAGVSMMTVSRVMNDKPGVGEETRERIRQLAAEMDYHPSQIARSLATRQTSSIGLVVPDIANPFFAQIARGAEDAAFEHNYNLFLINTAEDIEREIVALASLLQKEIDGIILCSSRLPPDDLESHIQSFPAVVLFNRELGEPMPNVATLNVNDRLGALQAVRHFVAYGRRRIAIIAGPVTSISGQRRLDGYRVGLQEAQIIFDPGRLEHCEPTTEGGHAAATAILTRRPRVDAIFAFNDLVAVGVLQACEDAGKKVPDDIAVIGADDIPIATMLRPQLTTLHIDLRAVGAQAMALVLAMIDGRANGADSVYEITPELVIRESA
ncbi:MAG: LacI family DNA-binding transcriptional regulator [Anaerolineae bacterium]